MLKAARDEAEVQNEEWSYAAYLPILIPEEIIPT